MATAKCPLPPFCAIIAMANGDCVVAGARRWKSGRERGAQLARETWGAAVARPYSWELGIRAGLVFHLAHYEREHIIRDKNLSLVKFSARARYCKLLPIENRWFNG
jgi:hypothetical protein